MMENYRKAVEKKTSELISQGRQEKIKSIEDLTSEILKGLPTNDK